MLILNTMREGYAVDQIKRTMTVAELRDFLEDYDDETPVYLSFDNGKELEDYFILLIPNAFLNQKDTVHVSKSGAWFNNFQVSKEELKGILDMYAETLNMSKERTD